MPAFATDAATADYYEQRAAEYDEWYTGEGKFSERDRPGWDGEVDQVVAASLPTTGPHARRGMWHRLLDPAPAGLCRRSRPESLDGRDRPVPAA